VQTPTKKLLVPKKPFFTVSFFSWLAFITYLSLASFSGPDTGLFFGFDIPHVDKVAHFIFYLTASFLGVFFLREKGEWGIKLSRALLLMFLGTVVYGILIEVLQHIFTTSREADIFDALANSFGSLLGVLTSFNFAQNELLIKLAITKFNRYGTEKESEGRSYQKQ